MEIDKPGFSCADCGEDFATKDRPRVRLKSGREISPVMCAACLPAWLEKKPGAEVVQG
jgi:hypothetical protein